VRSLSEVRLFRGTWAFAETSGVPNQVIAHDFGPYPAMLRGADLSGPILGDRDLAFSGLVPRVKGGCSWLELAEDAQGYLRCGACAGARDCGPKPPDEPGGDAGAAGRAVPTSK
jgi:hypothetical protein